MLHKILIILLKNPQFLDSNQHSIRLSNMAFNNSPRSLQISSSNSNSRHLFLNFSHNKVNSRHNLSFPHSSRIHKFSLVKINKTNKMRYNSNHLSFSQQLYSNHLFSLVNRLIIRKSHLFSPHRLPHQLSSARLYLNL